MKLTRSRILIAIALVIAITALAGNVFAQDTSWCVSPDGVTPIGCAEITIAPAGTVGDFYLGDVPMATAQNPGRLVLPVGTHTVNIRNIVSTEEGFGTLFVYNDASTSVTVQLGKIVAKSVTATKKFIRGTMALTCDIKGATAADLVMCQVTIDGVPQPDLLTPGAVRNYVLDPGAHAVNVTLVGDSAIYWSPAFRDQSVTITAGKTAAVKPAFLKKGHLIASLDQPNTVGDWYVNGVLIATQAPAIDQWVEPSKNHKIEVKALTDSTAAGLYYWKDATATVNLPPGSSKSQVIKLTKVWLKGFLDLTCDIKAATPADQIWCAVTIDGVPQPDLVAPGAVAHYVLDPGAHVVQSALNGPSSIYWSPTMREQKVTITAGKTATFKPAYLKAGHLIANMNVAGAVGDWYLDGVLVATQAAGFDAWVEPSKAHKVEVKAINDPAAAGRWVWKDATASVTLTPAQEKTQTLAPVQQWLVGYIELACNITNAQPGMSCLPVLDGVQQPLVSPGGLATYQVPVGAHKLVVTIAPASDWGSTPKTFNANVQGGKTFKANATMTAVIPTFKITLINNSYAPICNLYLPISNSPEKGPDKLSGQINQGQSRTFTVDKGTYDIYAQNCKTNPLYLQLNVPISSDLTIVVTGPQVTSGTHATFNIENTSVYTVCMALFAPVNGEPWDWLGPDQVILPNQSHDLLLTTGVWDFLLFDCSGGIYWIGTELVTGNGGIILFNYQMMTMPRSMTQQQVIDRWLSQR